MDEQRAGHSANMPPETSFDLESLDHDAVQRWHPEFTGGAAADVATHTSVLNLIIYAPDDDARERARRVTEHLATMQSCRVIIVTAPTVGDVAGAYSACRLGGTADHGPCVERIELPKALTSHGQLHSLITPLRIPELPSFLWWTAVPPFSDTEWQRAISSVEHLVIDTFRFSDLKQLKELARLLEREMTTTNVADLNWERLQPWRELTARFFEIPGLQWALSNVHDVDIEVGEMPDRSLPTQPLLLTCWLAHCLEWRAFEFRRTRRDRWYIGAETQRGRPIRIMVRARPGGGHVAGHLLTLSIDASDETERRGSLTLNRSRGSALIRMHAKSGVNTTMHHAVRHPLLDEEVLLARLLDNDRPDPVYRSTVAHAAALVEKTGGTTTP